MSDLEIKTTEELSLMDYSRVGLKRWVSEESLKPIMVDILFNVELFGKEGNDDEAIIKNITMLCKEVLGEQKKPVFFEIPENITLDFEGDILFNDCKQYLAVFYDFDKSTYDVETCEYSRSRTKNFVLVPCKREDLERGDTAYRTDDGDDDFSRMAGYCKILNDEEYACESGRNIFVQRTSWRYWFKVVRRSEVLGDE